MSNPPEVCPLCMATDANNARTTSGLTTCPECGRSLEIDGNAEKGVGNTSRSTARHKRLRAAGLVIVSLVVIGIAGFSISRALEQAGILRTPATPANMGSTKPAAGAARRAPSRTIDIPVERSELRIYHDQPGVGTIVVLTDPGELREFEREHYGAFSRLGREIVRQGLLLAVRDHFRLPVRDLAIGDPAPAGQAAATVDVTLHNQPQNGKLTLTLASGKGNARVVFLEKLIHPEMRHASYSLLSHTVAELAANELRDALTKAGLVAKPAPASGPDRLPDGVIDRLDRMDFVDQFAAVRLLHDSIQKERPSPLKRAAIARAYANLGLLTESQWDASARAFKARSLLYAQQMVIANPKSPVALWHRAYGLALSGAHLTALDDFEEIGNLLTALPESERPAPPAWVPLIDAFVRFQPERLAALEHGAESEFATLLRMIVLEEPHHTDIAVRSARSMIQANPDCFRAHDTLCAASGVANLHLATEIAPATLSQVTPRRIAELPDLPPAARKAALAFDEVEMTHALDQAANPASEVVEPSWGALAKIVRETRFLFTYYRLNFMSIIWHVPTDDYWQETRPLVEQHRFRPFLESYVIGSKVPGLEHFAKTFDVTDLDQRYNPMIQRLKVVARDVEPKEIFGICKLLNDWTARDLSNLVSGYREQPSGVDYARKLHTFSPYCPLAMGELIEFAWPEAEKDWEKWQGQVGDHPTFLASLARHQVKTGQDNLAKQSLEKYIKQSADLWAYENLAEIHKKQGNEVAWKQTLDDFLNKVEDHGLDHAKLRVKIANGLMDQSKFAEARPYADKAAATGAGWAMSCAMRCAEGQKDWQTAEAWARAETERYPDTAWSIWFQFCERTGHGDRAAALEWTREYARYQLGQKTRDVDFLLGIGTFSLLSVDKDALRQVLEMLPDDISIPFAAMTAAALWDLAAQPERSAQELDRFVSTLKPKAPKSAAICEWIRQSSATKKPEEYDLKAVDAILDSIVKENRGTSAVILAAHLTARNRPDLARPYWQIVADCRHPMFWWNLYARKQVEKSAEAKTKAGSTKTPPSSNG